jgi:hypothetical protein
LEGDAAGVRARRVLAKLIAEEQLQVDPSKANDAHAPTQIADDMTEGRPAADN